MAWGRKAIAQSDDYQMAQTQISIVVRIALTESKVGLLYDLSDGTDDRGTHESYWRAGARRDKCAYFAA